MYPSKLPRIKAIIPIGIKLIGSDQAMIIAVGVGLGNLFDDIVKLAKGYPYS